MNFIKSSLALSLLCQPSLADLFPNGNFDAGGDLWFEVGSPPGNFVFSYPTTGGNPGGFGIINHATVTDNNFGLWVGNDDADIMLSTLGLNAGEAYDFSQDMKLLSGTQIGGFKLDFFDANGFVGTTNNLEPDLIGDGSTWETYTFRIDIPLQADRVKVVPLWGGGSEVGFDNIGFDPTPFQALLIPNGDFENGDTSWAEAGAGASFSYPATGGNPAGHGTITSGATEPGFWTAAGGAPIALGALGLTPGDSASFKQDMRIDSGGTIGGLRLEFFNGAAVVENTGNLEPDLIGDGSTWETYLFPVNVPSNATHVKVLVLGATGSTVSFDNVTVGDSVTPPTPVSSSGGSELFFGTLFQWSGVSASSFYQPQVSQDGSTWVNLGPPLTGSASGQSFDPSESPFSRVLEAEAVLGEAVINGSFEESDLGDPACPLSWLCLSPSGQVPELIDTDAFEGTNSLRIQVQNDASGTPNQSEIQQNISAEGGSIEEGETYDFSFRAKQISSGDSYVQNYRLQWLNDSGAVVSEAFGFTPINTESTSWTEISRPGLVAPSGAVSVLIQIFGATGAVAGAAAEGGVLIDAVSLASAPSAGSSTVVSTTNFESGVGIKFPTETGRNYQAQVSHDLNTFDEIGPLFMGNGEPAAMGVPYDQEVRFFNVIESP